MISERNEGAAMLEKLPTRITGSVMSVSAWRDADRCRKDREFVTPHLLASPIGVYLQVRQFDRRDSMPVLDVRRDTVPPGTSFGWLCPAAVSIQMHNQQDDVNRPGRLESRAGWLLMPAHYRRMMPAQPLGAGDASVSRYQSARMTTAACERQYRAPFITAWRMKRSGTMRSDVRVC